MLIFGGINWKKRNIVEVRHIQGSKFIALVKENPLLTFEKTETTN